MGSGGAAFIAEWLAASQGVSPPFFIFFWGRLLITYLCDDCLFGVAPVSAINNAICTRCGSSSSSRLFAK